MRQYHQRVKGQPCWHNPVVLILDFLCQRENRYEPTTYMLYVGAYTFSIVFFFNEFFYEWWGTRLFGLLWLPAFSFLGIDNLYRHYRNKYLKKHNLPGPYGYGSIDDFPHYEDEK